MNNELKNALAAHEEWLDSKGVSGARFRGRNFDMRGADLRGADLIGANLYDANLCGAKLCGADLRDANLRDSDLRNASLRGANLCDANLSDASLRGACLGGADLRGAIVRGADLPDGTFIILGEPYHLQISNGELVQVGCQSHKAEEWRNFSKREIEEMDGKKALLFYPRLMKIIDLYLGDGKHPDWVK